jgi:hypothetical protein
MGDDSLTCNANYSMRHVSVPMPLLSAHRFARPCPHERHETDDRVRRDHLSLDRVWKRIEVAQGFKRNIVLLALERPGCRRVELTESRSAARKPGEEETSG